MSVTLTLPPETSLHVRLPADAAGVHMLVTQIRSWGVELSSDAARIADVDLSHAGEGLQTWLAQGFHGSMDYMANHGMLRTRPTELIAETVCAIAARMSHLPHLADPRTPGSDWHIIEWDCLRRPEDAITSFYAWGRGYHRVLRRRLQRLVEKIAGAIGPYGFRVLTDSVPVLEVTLATNGGLG